jgi:hypothetical protein
MSREINQDEPLSEEDRKYLEDRGNYALIRRMDEMHGTAPEPEAETEESLLQQIADREAEVADLRARHTALVLAREQQEAGVKDNTVVDGQGGSEAKTDTYDELNKPQLSAEIEKRNTGRDPEDKMSSSGTKAQLIERLRADDAEYEEEDEDDEDDE